MDDIVTLDYGSGGKKTSALIEKLLLPALGNKALNDLGDGAILPGGEQLVFSTDSFVVSPCFFPGGDIGELCVCGTVNDVSVSGGEAKYLSLSFIIEEGFPFSDLEKIVESIRATAERAGVSIVTGDTKVVEKGRGDGIYINTAGIGVLKYPGLSTRNIREGDAVLLSGTAGDHGAAVMLSRSGLEGDLLSDAAPLNKLCAAVLESGAEVRCLRDPTRGGVATTLNEFAEDANVTIVLKETDVPVREDVNAACELLGLDPLYCANEGKLLCVVPEKDVERALEAMRSVPEGVNAARIGTVSASRGAGVLLETAFGGTRILQKLSGAQLPRIC